MSEALNYQAPLAYQPKRFGRGLIGWILFVTVALLLYVWLRQQAPTSTTVPFSTFHRQVQSSNVLSVVMAGDEIHGQVRTAVSVGSTRVTRFHTLLPGGLGGSWEFNRYLLDSNPAIDVRVEPANNILVNFFLPLIPWVVIMGFVWLLIVRSTRRNDALRRQPMPVVVVNPGAT